MDKRYQVFVSSTYRDLTDERRAVIQALLEMDAIPAGMELFPAADSDAWELIKRVIEHSDYYVLIVGGRYGSTTGDGISFTEREYVHAVESGIPVLAFLHEKPGDIAVDKSDLDPSLRKRLEEFRAKVENSRHCKYWNDAEQLGSRVARSLMHQIKTTPRTGWVRSDQVASSELLAQINALRTESDGLKARLLSSSATAPEGIRDLVQGKDVIPIKYSVISHRVGTVMDAPTYTEPPCKTTDTCMDDVFKWCAPRMLGGTDERSLQRFISDGLLEQVKNSGRNTIDNIRLHDSSFHTLKVQMMALGLIRRSEQHANRWELTPFGEQQMISAVALRRK